MHLFSMKGKESHSATTSTYLRPHRRVRIYSLQIDLLCTQEQDHASVDIDVRADNDITTTNQSDCAFLAIVATGWHSIEGVDKSGLLEGYCGHHNNKTRNKREFSVASLLGHVVDRG